MGINNLNAFNHGMGIAKKAIQKQLRSLWLDIARDILYDAIQSWSGYNMTGNTINSYAAAVYEDGKIIHVFYPRDVDSIDRPTSTYSYPGDFIYFWHQKSLFGDDDPNYQGVGEELENNSMGVVRKYRNKSLQFQQVGRGNGEEDAKAFLNSYKAKNKLEICIVVGVPYAEYLENVRKLEVLQETYSETGVIADVNIKSVTPLKL